MAQNVPRLIVSLYTDEDVTSYLAPALRRRGYSAQSAVEAGNAALSDEAQLTYATESGMAILTYNIRDFVPLAQTWFLSNVNTPVLFSPNSSATISLVNCCAGYSVY